MPYKDPQKERESARERQRRYYARHREAIKARQKPEAARARSARYRARHPREVLERGARWRDANRDHARRYLREWRQANRDAKRGQDHRRRARKAGAAGRCSAADLEVVRRILGAACLRCGAVGVVQVDHVIPLAVGGTNHPTNLQLLCGSCNAAKGARSRADHRGIRSLDVG